MAAKHQVEILPIACSSTGRFRFPRWANYLVPAGILVAIGVLTYIPLLLSAGFSPLTTAVGYQPKQPIPFSHKVHAGDLGMDCRYCHSTVDQSAFAAVPPTQTCMNCHASIKPESALLAQVINSYRDGNPLRWIKVHDLPDFVYFNHAIHVNQGIGCATCHGRIDQIEEVAQAKPLSMGWCLECHRQPEKYLRPRDQIANMDWEASVLSGESQSELGQKLKDLYGIQSQPYMTSCTTCHR